MPNHVTNVLTITGTQKELSNLKNFVFTEDQIFSLENIEKTNKENWYEWRIENWGTKWDVYEILGWENNDKNIKISFLTAWSTPQPALLKLSKMFPKVKIEVQFADEDTGFNCGQYTLKNGKEINFEIPKPGSNEAYDFAKTTYMQRYRLDDFQEI